MNPCFRSSRYGCARRTVHPSAANARVTARSTSTCAGQHTWFADCRKSPLAIIKTSPFAAGIGASITGIEYAAIVISSSSTCCCHSDPEHREGEESPTYRCHSERSEESPHLLPPNSTADRKSITRNPPQSSHTSPAPHPNHPPAAQHTPPTPATRQEKRFTRQRKTNVVQEHDDENTNIWE